MVSKRPMGPVIAKLRLKLRAMGESIDGYVKRIHPEVFNNTKYIKDIKSKRRKSISYKLNWPSNQTNEI